MKNNGKTDRQLRKEEQAKRKSTAGDSKGTTKRRMLSRYRKNSNEFSSRADTDYFNPSSKPGPMSFITEKKLEILRRDDLTSIEEYRAHEVGLWKQAVEETKRKE